MAGKGRPRRGRPAWATMAGPDLEPDDLEHGAEVLSWSAPRRGQPVAGPALEGDALEGAEGRPRRGKGREGRAISDNPSWLEIKSDLFAEVTWSEGRRGGKFALENR